MTNRIILLGGCFWGLEYVLCTIPGIVTRAGYAGGHPSMEPTYYNLRRTGDAEAVEVTWEDGIDRLAAVVTAFAARSMQDPSPAHDPRYRRAVICADHSLQAAIRAVLPASFGIESAGRFVAAEAGHQQKYLRDLGPPDEPSGQTFGMPAVSEPAPDEALRSALGQLAEMVAAARIIVPFTGAGISTECGIPDYRSPGGVWTMNDPVLYSDFLSSEAARTADWQRQAAMHKVFKIAAPGRGHKALAALHAAGRVPALITQNIDGLHQASGMPMDAVVELHGSAGHARCVGCRAPYPMEWALERFAETGAVPECSECLCPVKVATVSFGEKMPEAEMARAFELAERCDLFLVVGSSLSVWPAAKLPAAAKRNGAKLVIVNGAPTPQDEIADLVIRHDIGDALQQFC